MKTDKKKFNIAVRRPFGPSIAKVIIPEDLISSINDYIDKVIKDEKKVNTLDYGNQLAGNVKQEFKLEKEFMKECGWSNFLIEGCAAWMLQSEKKQITKMQIINSWIVRQFENDYNPLHVHGGHISGVGYLKVPSNFGEYSQKTKTENYNGALSLVHGSRMFNSPATFNVKPKVGDFYFFPNYLMHVVYPFSNSNEERRSISFNAFIDEKIYNPYGRN